MANLHVIFGLPQLFEVPQYFHVKFDSCHLEVWAVDPKNYVFIVIVYNILIFDGHSYNKNR